MALLKFMGGIRLRAALVKCGITLAVALLDLTAGVILTAKKSGNKSMGGPFGQWAHQYDVPPRTHRVVREVWLPRATNIQAAYVDYVPFLFSLATFSYVRTTNRSTWSFSIALSCLSTLFQPRVMRLVP